MHVTPIARILATTAAAWMLAKDDRARAAKPDAAPSRQR
jgi:hypothetical protein